MTAGLRVGSDIRIGAMGFGAIDSDITPVSPVNPLPVTTTGGLVTWTQTVVTLSPAASGLLIAANPLRRALRWMNVGSYPFTAAPGLAAAVVGTGFSYEPPSSVGRQGGSDTFTDNEISSQAFSAISTGGTTVIVWEGAISP